MFQTKVVEKLESHILYSITFVMKTVPFMRQCGKNVVERGRSQMAIWRMRNACWIPIVTNTHTSSLNDKRQHNALRIQQ